MASILRGKLHFSASKKINPHLQKRFHEMTLDLSTGGGYSSQGKALNCILTLGLAKAECTRHSSTS
jgi:hypothetical protein